MLTSLCIYHFAIVKRLELDFSQGMTAFTGETGAGKSIMIDALMLALGSRADTSVIRPGEEQCDITASFSFDPESEPALWLAEHDIPYQDNELYLRRVIHHEGRSKSYINGQPFPLQKIKELSEKLVHLHGQHQQQTLMQHQTHRSQLDHFAQHHDLLNEVTAHYKLYQALVQELEYLHKEQGHKEKIHLLEFKLEELSQLKVQEDELTLLHQEHLLLHHAKEYLVCSQQIREVLNGDETPTVCSSLSQAINLLHSLPVNHHAIKNAIQLLNDSLIQCEEAENELSMFHDQVILDPDRLIAIEERMSALHHMARKYNVDGNQLFEYIQKAHDELTELKRHGDKIIHIQNQLNEARIRYQQAALTLRSSRQIHATKLAQEITKIIQQLGMPKGWIELELSPLDSIHPQGQDKVEYKVCTNPGMAPAGLNKIASGGELSRISLAIQMITAERSASPTLLFDEVDVGIGGATAALVGKMLRNLGSRLQVFCVTHQPQVAASAHHHFMVQKQSDHQQTFTQISSLSPEDKVDELARMIGGLTITEQTRSHAKELLAQAHD
jgi:DNA repair protein RecN (Recombination protein N)